MLVFYFPPFFRFSPQELKDGKGAVTKLTDKWFQDINGSPLISELSDTDDETVELSLKIGRE